jgi:hypothetical protein
MTANGMDGAVIANGTTKTAADLTGTTAVPNLVVAVVVLAEMTVRVLLWP